MNDRPDSSEDFSLERRRRAGDYSNRDEGADDAAKSPATDKSSPAAPLDNTFPDRIRRKYYVVTVNPARISWTATPGCMRMNAASTSRSKSRSIA